MPYNKSYYGPHGKIEYRELLACITKYYPIGILEADDRYLEYPGFKLWVEILHTKEESAVYQQWKGFIVSFTKKLFPIIKAYGESYENSYIGRIVLERKKMGMAKYEREIRIYFSLLGPFYTILGVDTVEIFPEIQGRALGPALTFDPILFVSPFDIYDEWFVLLREKVYDIDPTCRFVPFELLKSRVDSLRILGGHTRCKQDASVFQALFSSDNITDYKVYGHSSYEKDSRLSFYQRGDKRG